MEHLLFLSEQKKNQDFDIPENLLIHLKDGHTKSVFAHVDVCCYSIRNNTRERQIETAYFVGVDWIAENRLALMVESKLNESDEVDVIGMLFDSLSYIENINHLDGLMHIEYEKSWIEIPEQKDVLTPILIIQFLSVLKQIIRKGLKKDYYRITENLSGRIKGKILVGEQIKQNVVKNRGTQTICNYQEYGINHIENQFLKSVLRFIVRYSQTNQRLFYGYQRKLKELLAFCEPAFVNVQLAPQNTKTVIVKHNSFYSDYRVAVDLGEAILKKFAFNITKRNTSGTTFTPPFWIDMSKLFEMYVFGKLKNIFPNPGSMSYHDRFYRKETDILIRDTEYKCVIECKYKPQYRDETVELGDKRQVIGYTRLKRVYKLLGENYERIVKGVIIYSDQHEAEEISMDKLFKSPIEEYIHLYKLGIKLPSINR